MRAAIKNILIEELGRMQLMTKIGEVLSIDDVERTCKVQFIDGSADKTCRLQATRKNTAGLYIKPSIGSYVAVTFIKPTEGVVSAFSEIDEIEMLGSGDFLARFNELKSGLQSQDSDINAELGKIKTSLDAIVTAFSALGVTIPPYVKLNVSTDIDAAKIDELKTTA